MMCSLTDDIVSKKLYRRNLLWSATTIKVQWAAMLCHDQQPICGCWLFMEAYKLLLLFSPLFIFVTHMHPSWNSNLPSKTNAPAPSTIPVHYQGSTVVFFMNKSSQPTMPSSNESIQTNFELSVKVKNGSSPLLQRQSVEFSHPWSQG
jgi:hypothetical protein